MAAGEWAEAELDKTAAAVDAEFVPMAPDELSKCDDEGDDDDDEEDDEDDVDVAADVMTKLSIVKNKQIIPKTHPTVKSNRSDSLSGSDEDDEVDVTSLKFEDKSSDEDVPS